VSEDKFAPNNNTSGHRVRKFKPEAGEIPARARHRECGCGFFTAYVSRTAASGNAIGDQNPRRHDGGVPHKPGYLPAVRNEAASAGIIYNISAVSDNFIFFKETETMKKIHSFLKISVLAVLAAAMAFTLLACGGKDEGTAGTEITVTIAVINKAGETTEHTVTTTGTTLADALVDGALVEENYDDYGLYFNTVLGEVADYSVDQSYWALSKDGEYLMTGASSTKIADGEHYELTYTVYEG
jgi:hypothetical protein